MPDGASCKFVLARQALAATTYDTKVGSSGSLQTHCCYLNTVLTRLCNTQGCCALSTCFNPCRLALPSSSKHGIMEVYNAATPGGDVLCQIKAHKSPVAVMAWNEDASLLASASQKGTVLRVHSIPQVRCVKSSKALTVVLLCTQVSSNKLKGLADKPPGRHMLPIRQGYWPRGQLQFGTNTCMPITECM